MSVRINIRVNHLPRPPVTGKPCKLVIHDNIPCRQCSANLPTGDIPLRLAGGVAAGDSNRLQFNHSRSVAG